MGLAELVVSAAILDGGDSIGKGDIVRQLLLHLAAEGHIDSVDIPGLFTCVMGRESVGSTGIGQGIAVPHGKHAAITRPLMVLAVCKSPVDFDSLDREPTDLIALCLAPREPPGAVDRQATRLSQSLFRHLGDEGFRQRLRAAVSPQAIFDVLRDIDRRDSGSM